MSKSTLATFSFTDETGYDHSGYPMVTGVPLEQGRVHDPETLVLRSSNNRPLDVSAEVTARWADGSIKWLLLTAPQMKAKGGAKETFTLAVRSSQGGANADKPSGVQVKRVAQGIRVDTGRLRFTIRKDGPLVKVFESRVADQWQKRGGELDDTVIVAHEGERTIYRASAAPREVEIESASSKRVVVAVRGTHTAENGGTFGPYILRFECLADSPQLRLTHSLVFDGDPQTDQLWASEITFNAAVGEERAFAFGADEGLENRFPEKQAHFTADFRYAELYQDSATHWRLERWVDLANRSVFCDEGVHSDGWMELSGSAGRVAAAVRECWQNHPKSLFADAGSGEMRIGLYARRAEPLNLRRYSDLVYNHTYECPSFKQLKEGKKPPYQPEPRKPQFNAHGLRKTHSIALLFDEPNPSRATLFYNKPLRLTWPPAYNRQTGIVNPAGSKLTPQARTATDSFLDLLGREMQESGGTGYIDYFDLPLSFDVETQRWHHDYGGFGYLNNEGMPNLGLFQAWLLTGRRDALELGAAMARHNNDIDSVHLGQFAGKGCRHNVTHWADQDREPRISQPQSTKLYYYVTGDRSYMDIVPIMLEMWRREFAEPRRMTAYGYVPSLISSLLAADEAGIEDCDTWLRQCADALAAGIDEQGVLRSAFIGDATRQRIDADPDSSPETHLMICQFGAVQTFAELAERYEHQPLRDALVRYARYQAMPRPQRVALEGGHDWKEIISIQQDSINTATSLDLYGYAYQLTGDERFRETLKHLDGKLMVRLEEHGQTRYGQPNASTKRLPVGHIYADIGKDRLEKHRLLFPLFDVDACMQHKLIAFWLHKLQGAAVLGVLDDAK